MATKYPDETDNRTRAKLKEKKSNGVHWKTFQESSRPERLPGVELGGSCGWVGGFWGPSGALGLSRDWGGCELWGEGGNGEDLGGYWVGSSGGRGGGNETDPAIYETHLAAGEIDLASYELDLAREERQIW